MDKRMRQAVAALNAIAARELRGARSPRRESYPAVASCGHAVTVYQKALVKTMAKRICPKCVHAAFRSVNRLTAELSPTMRR